ncbi:MAG: hypothetical protein WA885_20380 [Phormidesmis sp.]
MTWVALSPTHHCPVRLPLAALGSAIASLLFSAAAATAQATPTALPKVDCYVEWEANVRLSLESLCNSSNALVESQPSSSTNSQNAVGSQPSALPIPIVINTSPQIIRVEVIADPNPVILDSRASRTAPGGLVERIYLPPRRSNRRYERYQRFQPSPRVNPRPLGRPDVPLGNPGLQFRYY